MSSTLKSRIQKCSDHFSGQLFGNEAGRHANDVCIVVLSCEFSNFFLPADGSTDLLMFVGGNGHPICTTANQYAKGVFTVFYCFCHRMGWELALQRSEIRLKMIRCSGDVRTAM